ncbi:MAG: hypothetical protein OHK0038_03010 [Flammeovirgaceae bacterium]
MTENRISINLSQSEIDKINAAIKTLSDILQPYLIALEAEDKAALPKIKDKTIAFAEKANQYIQNNPEFIPPYLDVNEFKKDYHAFNTLNQFLKPLVQLVSNLEDTATLCGSEALQAILMYYNSIKMAAKNNVPGAKSIYDDLSVRFEAQKALKKKDANN